MGTHGRGKRARDAYGRGQFGEQTLIARRLIEAGVPFVRVGRAWWDSHGQNFETHQEMVPELDHVMAALIDDLKDRGLLEHTLLEVVANDEADKKLERAIRKGEVKRFYNNDWIADAERKNILTAEEARSLADLVRMAETLGIHHESAKPGGHT